MKKTYNLPPVLVARVKRMLGAKTETEAIIQLLEEAAKDDKIYRAIKRVSGRLPNYRPLRG